MESSSVFTEETDLNHLQKKFTMLSVREGSVIDIEYKIQSPFFFHLRPWSFQDVIPERYSEYEVRIPEYFDYKVLFTGYYPLFINETSFNDMINYRELVRRMATRDVPAMKRESFTSSMMNYHTRVEFEFAAFTPPKGLSEDLYSTWDKIIHELIKDEDFGGQIRKTGIMKEAAQSLEGKASLPVDRMILAYNFIRTGMKWNKYRSIYPTTNLRKAYSDGKGNSADINLNLILLLKDLGINADPVVLSTRDNGIIRESNPNFSRLNYVIACADIGGKKYLLDATDINRPYSMLPFRCLNGKGILAIDDSLQWIDLLNQERSNTRYFGNLKITPDGKLEGKMNITYDGLSALTERNDIRDNGEEQYSRDLKDKIPNSIIDSVHIESADILAPMNVSYYLQSQELTQNSGNMIFFNSVLGMGQKTNPLSAEKREYPVDLGHPIKDSYIFVVEIPDGYTVESLPQKVSIALPDNAGTFKFSATLAGNRIAVNSIFNLNKTFYVMDEYTLLRELYAQMVAKQAEKIVLKKS